MHEEEVPLYRTEGLRSLLKLKQRCAACDDPESHLRTGRPWIHTHCTGNMTDEGRSDTARKDCGLGMTEMSVDKNHGYRYCDRLKQ